MRIILSFLIGLLLSFYLSELFFQIRKKLTRTKILLPFSRSVFGFGLLFTSIAIGIFGSSDPLKVLESFFLAGAGLGLILHHLLSQGYLLLRCQEEAFARKHERGIERTLEILPGALTWLAITSPLWLSYTLPFAVAYIIIIADIYWLISAIKIAVLIYLGYRKIDHAKKQDWLQRLQEDFPDEWGKYYHFVEIHTYKEPLEVLEPAFEAIINSNYPAKKIFFGIGLEERDSAEKIAAVMKYAQKNQHKIGGIFVTIHPFGLPGEIPGPASNRNFIIKNAVRQFQKLGIKPEQTITTTLDADFVIHPQFLAGMLHKYLSTPKEVRDKRSFTGAFLYYNNYWQAPTPMRIIASGTAFWQLAEMVGSDKYMNFSSLSMNLKSLLNVGLWIPDKVNDDSGFFWKAYYHFKGDYKVIPHFLPISADTVLDTNLIKTFKNQYAQQKRWAYGVEHVPFIIMSYFRNRDVDFWNKTGIVLFKIWSDFKWGTLALFVTFAGLLIPIVNPNYTQSVVAYNLPVISSYIMTGAFIGIFSTIYVHEKTVPKRPQNWSILQKLWSYLQWALVPVVMVTITAIPVIDAQTRLMLGKYMEFRVTIKARQV